MLWSSQSIANFLPSRKCNRHTGGGSQLLLESGTWQYRNCRPADKLNLDFLSNYVEKIKGSFTKLVSDPLECTISICSFIPILQLPLAIGHSSSTATTPFIVLTASNNSSTLQFLFNRRLKIEQAL